MSILLHKKAWLSTFFADLSTLFTFFARRTVLNFLTIFKRGGKFRRHFCGKCGKVVHNICGHVYHSAYLVENVEKLSQLIVDNCFTSIIFWEMWNSCAQFLWIA